MGLTGHIWSILGLISCAGVSGRCYLVQQKQSDTHVWVLDVHVASFPGPACSSLAVRNLHREPGLVRHVMSATGVILRHVTPDIAKSLCCSNNHKWSWKNLEQVMRIR